MASTPEQFAAMGLDILTEWAQVTERMVTFAAIFEARGGANQFNDAKFVAEEGQPLTDAQQAHNEQMDDLRDAALAVVTHHNELVGAGAVQGWYDAARRVRVNLHRTDY